MKFFTWLKSLFAPTVDSIVADIAAKAAKLHVVAEAKQLEAEAHRVEINARLALRAEALTVVERAKVIAAKFEGLVS